MTASGVDLAEHRAVAVDDREGPASPRRYRRQRSRSSRRGARCRHDGVPGVGSLHQALRRHHLGALHVAREFGHVVRRRMDDQLFRRSDLDDLAVLHDGDAVGEPDRLVEIMGDEDDGLVQRALQADELGLHFAPDQRIERGKGLVEEPDLGLDREASARCRRAAAGRPTARADRGLRDPSGQRGRSSRAPGVALPRAHPWIDSGKATFSSTVRCGSRAKFWNTMPILWRRMSMSSASLALSRSRPSNSTSPEVGSIRRDRQRSRVDLPEPDRPMTMKISPWRTSERGIAHRADQPRRSKLGRRGSPLARGEEAGRLRAETFQMPRQESFTGRAASASGASIAPEMAPAMPLSLDSNFSEQAGGARSHPAASGNYCAQAFHFASFASIQAAATSSIDLPSRSTSPESLFSSAASIV